MKSKKSSKGPQREGHLVVILEDMRSKFRAFGEGLSGLREKVDEGFARVDEKFARVDEGLAGLNNKMDEGFELMDKRFEKVGERLERIESDIRIIKNQIKVKVDLEEFKLLEDRVVTIEKRLAMAEK